LAFDLHITHTPSAGMKILVVDDNKDLAALLQVMLEEEGYEVRLAGDGSDGYSAYLLFQPDLVITDIQMPIKSGIELMELIRGHNPRMRAVYISGDLTRFQSILEEEKKKYQVGLLEKPFSKDELIKLISNDFLAPNPIPTKIVTPGTTGQAPTISGTTQTAPAGLQKNTFIPSSTPSIPPQTVSPNPSPTNSGVSSPTPKVPTIIQNPTGRNITGPGVSKSSPGSSNFNRIRESRPASRNSK